MSISSNNRKAGPYTCNGSTVSFPFSFKVFAAADVRVVLTDPNGLESDLTLGTNYSVSLAADQDTSPGGAITTTATYTVGYFITLTSKLQYLQPVTLTNQGGFYPRVVNDALDRLTILVQQLAEAVARSLKTAISTPTGVNPTLPAPVPYQLIGWNSDGTGFANADPSMGSALATDLANSAPGKGAALVQVKHPETGGVGRTVSDKLNSLFLESDFDTTANFMAASAAAARLYSDGRIDPFVKPTGELDNSRLSDLFRNVVTKALTINNQATRDYISEQARSYPRKYHPTAAWFEFLRLSPSIQPFMDGGGNVKMTETYVREVINEMATAGIDTLIVPYVEYFGYWFYTPGFAYPTDHDTSSTGQYWYTKLADARVENFNPVQVVLEQAQRNNMRVYLGLGRNGDTPLLQDSYNVNILAQADPNRYGLSLTTRMTNAINRTRQVAADLVSQFGSFRSFYGFYISHEPGHIGAANYYLTPATGTSGANVSLRTHGKTIMVAPGNTLDAAANLTFANLLIASGVDMFAPQDAVGPGLNFTTGEYTYVPQNAINGLAAYFAKWRTAVDIANGKANLAGRRLTLTVTCDAWEMGKKPAATLTPSATTGSVTFSASGSVFTAGDVGKIIWINNGRATITSQTGTAAVATVNDTLDSTTAATSGNWALTVATNLGYTNDYPATWTRVQNQLFELWPYVDSASLYSWFGHIDSGALSLKPAQAYAGETDYQTRAAALYANLNSHIVGQRLKYRDAGGPTIQAIETFSIPASASAASVGADFGTYYPKHNGSTLLVFCFASYYSSPATATAASISITLKANGIPQKAVIDPSNTGQVGGGIPLFLVQRPKGLSNLYRFEVSTPNGTVTIQGADLVVLELL